MKKSPTEIDRQVGSRVRMQRVLNGMSQEKLGECLGVTFQQVQKYEKGINRIGASRLAQIAEALGVRPSYFFQDFEIATSTAAVQSEAAIRQFLGTPEGLELNRAFASIDDPQARKEILSLVSRLAGPRL